MVLLNYLLYFGEIHHLITFKLSLDLTFFNLLLHYVHLFINLFVLKSQLLSPYLAHPVVLIVLLSASFDFYAVHTLNYCVLKAIVVNNLQRIFENLH